MNSFASGLCAILKCAAHSCHWLEQVRSRSDAAVEATRASTMSDSAVVGVAKLGFPWQTSDPFLFCVYHDDLFPPGDEDLGPAIPQHLLWRGRNRGADFGGKWNMYHGEKVRDCSLSTPRALQKVHSESCSVNATRTRGPGAWFSTAPAPRV
eukprot:COSAG02_NODE_37_length_48203_cov_57.745708_16_plen_152_part_00